MRADATPPDPLPEVPARPAASECLDTELDALEAMLAPAAGKAQLPGEADVGSRSPPDGNPRPGEVLPAR